LVKLEKPAAIRRLDEIIELSDALMVARGDLGVEMPPEDVPTVQRQVIHACRVAGKPVIVATQMLESMISAPTPTRAEASDVATAVYEGADAVMLSAETAAGQYPVEAVTMMDRIARRVQEDPLYFKALDASRMPPEHTNSDAISMAACQVAGNGRRGGDRLIHQLGGDRVARGARASFGADPRPDFQPGDRAAARASVGRPLRPPRRHQKLQRHGAQGGAGRLSRGDRRIGPARCHHRRRPVRHPRLDQHPAHRLDRPVKPKQAAIASEAKQSRAGGG